MSVTVNPSVLYALLDDEASGGEISLQYLLFSRGGVLLLAVACRKLEEHYHTPSISLPSLGIAYPFLKGVVALSSRIVHLYGHFL